MKRLGRIIAAKQGRTWLACAIQAGRSLNGPIYTRESLKQAVEAGLFDRRPIKLFPRLDASGNVIGHDHQESDDLNGREVLNTIGLTGEARWEESTGSVLVPISLLEGVPEADALHRQLSALWESGGEDAVGAIGLSINGFGPVDLDGEVRLESIVSIEVVTEPAAGGRFSHRIAASRTSPMKKLLELLGAKYPRLLEGVDTKGAASETTLAIRIAKRLREQVENTEAEDGGADPLQSIADLLGLTAEDLRQYGDMQMVEQVMDLLGQLRAKVVEQGAGAEAPVQEGEEEQGQQGQATTPPEGSSKTTTKIDPETGAVEITKVTEARKDLERETHRWKVERTQDYVDRALEAAELGEFSQARIREATKGKVLARDQVSKIITDEKRYVDRLVSQAVADSPRLVEAKEDKLTGALAHMLSPKVKAPEGVEPWMGSFREFVERHFLGYGRLREGVASGMAGRRRLREAIDSTAFDQVFADALSRSVLAEYTGVEWMQDWRKIAKVVPYSDFRTHRVITLGWYGQLSTVAKGAAYVQMTSPTDREETIALAKKGGLETWTLEDFLNDDLGLIQKMIERIGQAAAWTVYELVFSQIRDATQPTMTDGYTLTSQSRSPVNEGTAVMSATAATAKTNLIASIVAMMKQTSGSGHKKGIRPAYAIIPFEKVEAYAAAVNELTGGQTGTDVPQAVRSVLGLAVPEAIIDFGTSNSTDWYLMAEPGEAEVIRLGALNGRTDPETFIADDEKFGSMFTNDQIELKTRLILAAAAVDYAGIYGNDAAT